MGASFVIALREGIEAALIVSILLAYLRQLRRDRPRPARLVGHGPRGRSDAAIGTALFAVGAEFEGGRRSLRRPRDARRRRGADVDDLLDAATGSAHPIEFQEKVDSALVAGGLALAALAFFAVLREGIETALFIFAAARERRSRQRAASAGS